MSKKVPEEDGVRNITAAFKFVDGVPEEKGVPEEDGWSALGS